jgi:oxaloacetate decarboxylase (Na+ extruding) subunit gamma
MCVFHRSGNVKVRIVGLQALKAKPNFEKSRLIDIVAPIALVAGQAYSNSTGFTYGLLMETSLIAQGLDLLLYGMGTVFTFLTLLVGITTAMSALVNRFTEEEVAFTAGAEVPNGNSSVEPRIAKAIQAAIDQHRGRK